MFITVQALGFLVSSTARDQVNDLTKQFSILKQKFDRGMQKEILEALISAGKSKYSFNDSHCSLWIA